MPLSDLNCYKSAHTIQRIVLCRCIVGMAFNSCGNIERIQSVKMRLAEKGILTEMPIV